MANLIYNYTLEIKTRKIISPEDAKKKISMSIHNYVWCLGVKSRVTALLDDSSLCCLHSIARIHDSSLGNNKNIVLSLHDLSDS